MLRLCPCAWYVLTFCLLPAGDPTPVGPSPEQCVRRQHVDVGRVQHLVNQHQRVAGRHHARLRVGLACTGPGRGEHPAACGQL